MAEGVLEMEAGQFFHLHNMYLVFDQGTSKHYSMGTLLSWFQYCPLFHAVP